MKMNPWQSNALFAIYVGWFLFLGIFIHGCGWKEKNIPIQQVEATRLTGKCFWWDDVEKQASGKPRCERTTRNRAGILYVCTRQRGHRGDCHAHFNGECVWVWN